MSEDTVRIAFQCKAQTVVEIDKIAAGLGLQRSDVARWALERYVEQGGGVPSGSNGRLSSQQVATVDDLSAVPV